MVFLGLLRLVLYIILLCAATYAVVVMIRRSRVVNKVWKIKEPLFRKFIEEETGQKIRETMFLNSTSTGDFQHDSAMVWFAFTADKVALIVKDGVLDEDGDHVAIFRKDEVSFKKVRMRIFELVTKNTEAPKDGEEEAATLWVGIPKKKMEILRHHIRRIELNKTR